MSVKTSESHPIRIDFLSDARFPVLENLGMTFAPGKRQSHAMSGTWERDLDTDLERVSERYRIDTLVSLLTDAELRELGIGDLVERCVGNGIGVIRFPVGDYSVPGSPEDYYKFISRVVSRLEDGCRVVVHCKGGLGRAGMTAACIAVAVSKDEIDGDEAIRLVRIARDGAVETQEQERFIREYATEKKFEQFPYVRPGREDALELTAYLPRLYASDFKPATGWLGGEKLPDGAITMPYPEYDPLVPEFFSHVSKECWADYEYTKSTAPRMVERYGFIESACVDDIKSLLTWCARVERFCDGHWEAVIEKGVVRRILERIKVLDGEGRFADGQAVVTDER